MLSDESRRIRLEVRLTRLLPLAAGVVLAFVATAASAATIIRLDTCAAGTRECFPPGVAGHSMIFTIVDGAVHLELPGSYRGDNAIGFNIAGPTDGFAISILTRGSALGGTDQEIGPFGSFEFLIDGPSAVPRVTGPSARFILARDAGFLSPFEVFAMNELGFLGAGVSMDFFAETFIVAGDQV